MLTVTGLKDEASDSSTAGGEGRFPDAAIAVTRHWPCWTTFPLYWRSGWRGRSSTDRRGGRRGGDSLDGSREADAVIGRRFVAEMPSLFPAVRAAGPRTNSGANCT